MLQVERVLANLADDQSVWMTQAQVDTVNQLMDCKHGIAAIHGLRPSTGYIVPPVHDVQILFGIKYTNCAKRKLNDLEKIMFENVECHVVKDLKLSLLTREEQIEAFNTRKEFEMNSIRKTLDGDRDDNYRQAHDRCYAQFGKNGLKANLVTEDVGTGKDKRKEPVMLQGYPVVNRVMFGYLELNRKVIQEGEYAPAKNSGVPVRMSNCIMKELNSRSIGYKTASLGTDNFDKVVLSKTEVLAEDVGENIFSILKG